MDEDQVASVLKGNTLRVYWFLLSSSNGLVGVRETQRALGFSSPALAVYHLDKLAELGLVKKTHGEYHLEKAVNVGILKQFVRLGTLLLPRYLLYATMFTALLVFYVTQLRRVDFYSIFALILASLATGVMWYETVRAWKQKP
jgi:predicted DNA-binding transcriptional regulator